MMAGILFLGGLLGLVAGLTLLTDGRMALGVAMLAVSAVEFVAAFKVLKVNSKN